MVIKSPSFENNTQIPAKFTCDGNNVNPALEFFDVPEETQSLVLIVDDPDAPIGVWTHWIIYNIPGNVRKINENQSPEGALLGINDFGVGNYGGPCPPYGTHRYFFKLYALSSNLDLDPGATKNDVENTMENFVIAKAELIGTYSH